MSEQPLTRKDMNEAIQNALDEALTPIRKTQDEHTQLLSEHSQAIQSLQRTMDAGFRESRARDDARAEDFKSLKDYVTERMDQVVGMLESQRQEQVFVNGTLREHDRRISRLEARRARRRS